MIPKEWTIFLIWSALIFLSCAKDIPWFPHLPNEIDKNPTEASIENTMDYRVPMGESNNDCDNAKDHLEKDWDGNKENYTCLENKKFYLPKNGIRPELTNEPIPIAYMSPHFCMNETIKYERTIPTFGAHRPLWAKWGEYTYLPKQRWLHNIEHGATVFLYHPCANAHEVNEIRKVIKQCLYRYIITPNNLLSPERPLALVAWGHSLEMSKASTKLTKDFIIKYSLKGPEQTSRDGQYDILLKEHAENEKLKENANVEMCLSNSPIHE